MSSRTPTGSGAMTVPELCAAVEQIAALLDDVATAVADPARLDLGAVPADLLADLSTRLLRAADRASAVATVTVGRVTAVAGPATRTLIAEQYASPRRWLEVEAGLAPSSAKAVLARARDLREHSAPVTAAWLTGAITGDAVRELTSGVTGALRPVTTSRADKERLRAEAVEVLLPVALAGTPADLKCGVARLRLLADSAYEEQAEVEAYEGQSLTCTQVGALFRLEAWLTQENAAAAMTVIDQVARRHRDDGTAVVHDPACDLAAPPPPPTSTGFPAPRWCTCGASAAAGVTSKDDWSHALAVAFGEHMTGQLCAGAVGTHHGVAPHVTVTVDVADLAAGLGAELAMPGHDAPLPISAEMARRIMCDASITPVVVQRLVQAEHAEQAEHAIQAPTGATGGALGGIARLLLSSAVAVLFVGRTERTATPRQRRALEARDRHCIFPGCRAHPRRCQAHHVVEWDDGGATDIDNLCLLCVRHHISVHEGGWTISRTPGTSPYETGCWTLAPPRPRP